MKRVSCLSYTQTCCRERKPRETRKYAPIEVALRNVRSWAVTSVVGYATLATRVILVGWLSFQIFGSTVGISGAGSD